MNIPDRTFRKYFYRIARSNAADFLYVPTTGKATPQQSTNSASKVDDGHHHRYSKKIVLAG